MEKNKKWKKGEFAGDISIRLGFKPGPRHSTFFQKSPANKCSIQQVLLIGAAIPVIGEILKFISWILAAVGFFNIKKSTQLPAPTPAVSISEEKRFCQYCGAQIPSNAAFCPKCGKKID